MNHGSLCGCMMCSVGEKIEMIINADEGGQKKTRHKGLVLAVEDLSKKAHLIRAERKYLN